MGRRIFIGLAVVCGAAAITYRFLVLPWWRTWGINPEEVARRLPGDEVIPDAAGGETRAITIDAPPAVVWPWLVQMGFGRAGWYSYDAIDMGSPSSQDIVPGYQDLKVGDLVPTHPAGGFVVKRLDPEAALVLYLDSELVQQQAQKAKAQGASAGPINLRATEAPMETSQPTEFAASWAFVLEKLQGGRTRLIERFRISFGETDRPWTKYTLPLMGFGVFVMMRQQMLGIKQRAERAHSIEAVSQVEAISV
jgi:hypothetical protein